VVHDRAAASLGDVGRSRPLWADIGMTVVVEAQRTS
jgi:hypothetical protein